MKVTDLVKLGKKSLKMFEEYISQENLTPPIRVYVRDFVTELEISETHSHCKRSAEIIQKPDWSTILLDFMEEKIKLMPELEQLAQYIAVKYKNNIHKRAEGCDEVSRSSFWLEGFIQKLIYEKLEGMLSEDLLIEYASLFKSELELAPSEYKYIHYLQGIFLESDSIKIKDNVVIKKPQKEDLEYTRNIFFDISRPQPLPIPSSILEIDTVAKDENECYEYINRILNALRLYKLGSIHSRESILNRKTAIWPPDSRRYGGRSYSIFRKYIVKESEIENFVDFIDTIEQKLNFNKEEKKYSGLFISLERYNSALLEAIDIDRKLMTAVMGLESLFTLKEERGENAYKLGVRVAKLLGYLNFDVGEVRALIKDAYKFRNMVVHGSYVSQNGKKRMNEIFPKILSYLRVSLIILLFNQERGKDKVVEIIDKSLISDIHDEELRKLLEKDLEKFGMCLFDK